MKNTILTLASFAILTGAANAQVTLEGTTYAAGSLINFNTQADFLAGTNANFQRVANDDWMRSVENPITGTAAALNAGTGQVWSFDVATGGVGIVGVATWAAGNINDFAYKSGVYQIRTSSAITLGGVNYATGSLIDFSNQADFLAGTNAHFQRVANDNYMRSVENPITGTAAALNLANGNVWSWNVATGGVGIVGTATWAAGNVNDFAYENGVYQVRVATVPEPSSTALLGLGALGLLVRRKR